MIHLDAIVVRVGDGAHVTNQAARIAVGVDIDGVAGPGNSGREPTRARRSGARARADLAEDGLRDVLVVCRNGRAGLSDAIEAA